MHIICVVDEDEFPDDSKKVVEQGFQHAEVDNVSTSSETDASTGQDKNNVAGIALKEGGTNSTLMTNLCTDFLTIPHLFIFSFI